MCQSSHRLSIEFQNFITCWEREEGGIVAEKSVAPRGGVTPTLNSSVLPQPPVQLSVWCTNHHREHYSPRSLPLRGRQGSRAGPSLALLTVQGGIQGPYPRPGSVGSLSTSWLHLFPSRLSPSCRPLSWTTCWNIVHRPFYCHLWSSVLVSMDLLNYNVCLLPFSATISLFFLALGLCCDPQAFFSCHEWA